MNALQCVSTSLEAKDVLNSILQWLEARIDLKHLAEVEQRHRDVMCWRPVDRPPVSIKGVNYEGVVRYSSVEESEDPVKLMVNQLAHPLSDLVPGLMSSVLLKDDFPLQIEPEYGVGIIASVFGAKCKIVENSTPWVEPLGGTEQMVELLDRGVPDLNNGLLPKVLETMDFFRQKLSPYPKCKQAIHITQPDLQGVFDVVHQLWGSDLFIYLYQDPSFVHRLFELVAKTYIDIVKRIKPYTTEEADDNCIYLHWALCRGNVLLKNDSPIMISPAMYRDFIRPYDEKIFREFGGGGIHFCGSGDHWREEMSATQRLGCIDFGQPEHNDLSRWYDSLQKHGVAIMRLPYPSESIVSGRYKELFPTGVSFSTRAPNLAEGKKIMAAVRNQE